MRMAICLGIICLLGVSAHAAVIGKATVTADQAPVMSGKEAIATAAKGVVFDVTEVKGDWFGVAPSQGWIHKSNVQFQSRPSGPVRSGGPASRPYRCTETFGVSEEGYLRAMGMKKTDTLKMDVAQMYSRGSWTLQDLGPLVDVRVSDATIISGVPAEFISACLKYALHDTRYTEVANQAHKEGVYDLAEIFRRQSASDDIQKKDRLEDARILIQCLIGERLGNLQAEGWPVKEPLGAVKADASRTAITAVAGKPGEQDIPAEWWKSGGIPAEFWKSAGQERFRPRLSFRWLFMAGSSPLGEDRDSLRNVTFRQVLERFDPNYALSDDNADLVAEDLVWTKTLGISDGTPATLPNARRVLQALILEPLVGFPIGDPADKDPAGRKAASAKLEEAKLLFDKTWNETYRAEQEKQHKGNSKAPQP